MEIDEKELKEILNQPSKGISEKNVNCPEPDSLLKAVASKLSRREKFTIIDHLFKCPACFKKFKAIKEYYKESSILIKEKGSVILNKNGVSELIATADGKISRLKTTRPDHQEIEQPRRARIFTFTKPAYRYLTALAASVIIIIGMLLIFQGPENIENDNYRGIKISKAQLISPKANYRNNQIKFIWKPCKNAKNYLVKLYDEELTPLWSSNKTENTYYLLPDAFFKKMKKNLTYFWKILVNFTNGEKGKSALQDFKLID